MLQLSIRKGRNMKKKGFTLIELLVVIAIIAMLLAILMPALNKVKKIAMRVICGTNLKGLGTAQNVYANDYDDAYVVQGGKTNPTWSTTGAMAANAWQIANLPWGDSTAAPVITTGNSLYLLVREADVSPKSFICPAGSETEFDGKNTNNLDLTQLWDFGATPSTAVSYSYHMPYKGTDPAVTGNTGKKGRYAATGGRSASFAMMADRNPFSDKKLVFSLTPSQSSYTSQSSPLKNDWTAGSTAQRYEIQAANAQPHDRDGQNVTYADGHNSYETRSDVGTKNDNIYTRWTMLSSSVVTTTPEAAWRTGTISGSPSACPPQGPDDSFLVNENLTPFPNNQ
jgi:prepilin-type N-terminal cleavage/methylation domain-containing protein